MVVAVPRVIDGLGHLKPAEEEDKLEDEEDGDPDVGDVRHLLTHSSGGNKHVSGFSHTCVENAKHLQTYNCVAFCTHVCLFPYLCVKIQTCVENSTQV